MTEILEVRAGLTVSVAADPIIGLEKIRRARPDVILLDLEMPRMDGLTFLRTLMAGESPIPVVVCSGHATQGGAMALRALEEGAVEVVAKPRLGVRDFLQESAIVLVDVLRAAAAARPRSAGVARAPLSGRVLQSVPRPAVARPPSDIVVALGASTGGTDALPFILEGLPENAPGVVIVQHMPGGYTAAFAQRLNQLCRIEVKEAASGDLVLVGRALIAPGNRHMTIQRRGTAYAVELNDGPLVSRHRPSVDVLFQSVARAAGASAVGAILTGMGDDGAMGLLEMRRAGARTLAQDEASCVIFGMPRAAIERDAAAEVVPLAAMSSRILTLTSA
jgi:two-component system, chemotaxis family, protein-glutamate methylesterase/glutaminase